MAERAARDASPHPAAAAAPAAVCVIGIGQPFRRDDGVGPAAVERLRACLPAAAEVRTHDGEPAGLLELWRGRALVIAIDATRGGGPPGTLRRWAADEAALPDDETFTSTHGFGLAQAVALGRALGALPERLVIYGMAGAEFGMGEGLSPAVAAALDALTRRVAAEVADFLAGPPNFPAEAEDA